MKKFEILKLPHGWFKGELKEKDIIDTIDATIMYWHLLVVETNELTQRERERVPIKNSTKIGYLYAYDGDGIDISPRMIYHRGTVQHGMAQTIKTTCDVGVIELVREHERENGDKDM